MTRRNRVFVDLDDLEGLQFQCARCAASISVPVAAFDPRFIKNCPNCQHVWGTTHMTASRPTSEFVRDLTSALATLKRELRNETSRGFTLTLELSPAGAEKE